MPETTSINEVQNEGETQTMNHLCSCTPARCQRQENATCAAELADIARQNQEAEREHRRMASRS